MGKPASALSTFFRELKRRKVFRVAAVYAIAGWLIIQVVETIFPRLHLPDWSITLVIVFVIIGFPIALILAWAFELTPEGVKRTEAAEDELQEGKRKTGLKIEYVLIALCLIAVAYLFYEIKVKRPEAEIPPVSAIRSIAVLPFVNMSADKDQEYFCDGLAEELLNMLAKVEGLRVIARTSSFSFKGKDDDIATIGEKLNVESVLEGSVRKAGDKVRITTQLIKVPDGYHLWSETYDRRLDDIFTVQEEISRQVVGALKIKLLAEPQARLARHTTENMEAYNLYLLGCHYVNKLLELDIEVAIEYFERALEIDSTYALAYAGLADAYTFFGRSHARSPEDTWPNAREMAAKALAIDEGLAEAHTSLAMVKLWFEWDWPGVEREFKRALEINPNSVDARLWYSQFLSAIERYDEALSQIERALELDPHSLVVNMLKAWILSDAGHYAEAILVSENMIESDPDNLLSHWILAYAYASQGMYEEAIAPLQTSMTLLGDDINDELGILGYLYGRLGRKAEALRQLEALDELAAKGRYVSPLNRAWVYIAIDDKDQAFAWLNKGYETRAGRMPFLKVQFFYDSLRDDSRFTALLKKNETGQLTMTKSPSALSTFLRELKRRKVFQVAVVYAVVGWLLIQVAETIFPRLHLPDWSITLVIVFVIIGFPIALILAWAFELTPEGVRRTVVVDRERLMDAAYPYQKEFKEVDRPMNVYDPAVEGLSSGKTISNYKIIEKIGEGGMGVVFKARDLKLDRVVALKFLPQGVFADEKERARFLQEARAASALNHPNVCIIHDLQEHEGQQFIVMEHVEGVTLREKVRESALPVEDVLSYATQIGEALQEAHAKGIIHRDVKSDNIMVTHRNEIKVMDFGLAKLKGAYRQTRRTSTVGTLAYMSPEHIKGEEVDGRMDIFSFGVVFYEMLTGRLPFYGDNQAALLYSILNREPEPLTRYRPGLSSGFLHMVDRSLEKDPADRFQSMKGVLIELRRLKRDTSKVSLETPTEPFAYTAPAARPGARAWRFVGSAALIAILAAGAYLLLQRTRAPAVPQFTNPRQVTTALGVEDYPTWSPEGGRLAYQSDQSGNWDIWVTQTGGGPPLNLTEDYEDGDRCPSWSPDGSQIAFQSDREGGGYFVMPALGGSPRKVAASSRIGYATPPQWSSDGSELACAVIDSALTFVEIVSLQRATSRRMRLTGKEKEYIRVWEMSWSGDGRYFAYGTALDRGSPNSQVRVMRLSDGKDFPVTDAGTLNLSPSWSRDGRYLYFVSNREGSKDLWQQQLGDDCTPVGSPRRLTVGQEMWYARFSPDGEKLAFSKGRSVSNLWRVPILEDRPVTWEDASQLTFGQATLADLQLSPDGTRLVLPSIWEGKRHAFLLPVQGGEPKRLTMDPMNQISPAWSPDGREIAYHSDEGGNRNIWVVSVEGGAPRQVTRSEFWDLVPAWSRDGREIAFMSSRSGNWDIWVIPAEGGEARQMTHHPADDGDPPEWSPDGKWLYFWSDRTGEDRRWRMPAAGGAPELVTGALALGERYTPKSPDWKKIYLERDGNIREVAVESGAERQVTDFTGKYGSFGSQATDGKYFYFVWSENTGDLWVMDVIRDE